ncbi:TlpA family protein disulfide reductase [Catenovulum agarivorans]|uniref:TlpA family protein disulfide reductase n=1 Tax=Catenovulum agarivorans TaxID=1172192 RepID=UPI0003797329|nr:TlpA disulfide reductase family protein [Catenovulum agarivorans]
MKKWTLLFIVIILILGSLKYLGFFAESYQDVLGKPIQRIELFDLSGKSHTFDELKNRETVIYFFASWCAPCYPTLSLLENFAHENDVKPRLLAIALDEDLDGIKAMVAKTGFTGTLWVAKDGTTSIQQRYFGNENRVVPFVLKLDSDTNIIERSLKLDQFQQWQAALVEGKTLKEASGL